MLRLITGTALAARSHRVGFNTSQSDWAVTPESFPRGAYNDAVVAAALAPGTCPTSSTWTAP